MKTAIIIGVGAEDELGASLCKRFATLGTHVFIAGRTQSKLNAVVSRIESNAGKATAHVTNAIDKDQIINLFDTTGKTGSVDVAIQTIEDSLDI